MNIPHDFQESYDLWYKKYIEETKGWVSEVNKNPFIAIKSHIHEDPITDLLAHILQKDEKIKEKFIRFLLKKAKYDIKKITVTDLRNTEIETQYSIKVTKSRLDLFIKIPNKCHIIIENKIFGAKEQQGQMQRYIDGVKKEGTTVLAFYATPDGQGECKTAGVLYSDDVIPLAFYSDDTEDQTIYKVLSDVKGDHPLKELTQDFCFYLRYRFFNQQSVSFLQKHINIDLCSQKCFEELFEEGEYPIISKNINPYACPKDITPYEYSKNYFMQLLKVHALNCYLLNEFEKDNCSYHAVFDGIRVKRKAKIGNTYCNVYFETKYDKNNFFMVITICSLNEIYKKNMKLLKDYWYKEQNELNEEFTYSLWLWIMNPKDIEERKDSILNLCKNYENYEDYIKFIFTNCMKKIFDAITENKEIDKEALEQHYKKYYRSFQQ